MVSEFEHYCVATLASENVVWQHPLRPGVHSVRLEACFTRFRVEQIQSNVKVLFNGRPVRVIGSYQPLLYVYVISSVRFNIIFVCFLSLNVSRYILSVKDFSVMKNV